MRLRAHHALFGASLVVDACSGASSQPTEDRAANTTRATQTAVSADTHAAPALDLRLEAKLAERDRLHDWRSTVFGSRIANPPVPARARPIPKHGALRLGAVATIRAYHYRHAYTTGSASDFGSDLADPPFSRDGRLDGHVVPPEALLTDAERDRVLALVRAAEEMERKRAREGTARAVLRCEFDPHHVLVFFDAGGVPIAKILVCMTCGEMRGVPSVPALGGEGTAALNAEEKRTFEEILDAHGLGAWTYGEGPELEELVDYERRTYGASETVAARGRERIARANDRPSGVPPDVTPKGAAREDRERFCVWLRAEMASRNQQRTWRVTGGFECKDGVAYRFSQDDPAPNDCDKAALCDVGFGEMEACLREAFLKGPEELCGRRVPRVCDGLLACLPYVVWNGR